MHGVAVNKKRLKTRLRGLRELRSYIIIVSFESTLHFATLNRYIHFKNLSIAAVDTSYE